MASQPEVGRSWSTAPGRAPVLAAGAVRPLDNDKARGYRKSALSFSSYLHEELFHYLLETGNLPKARRLTRGLREAFGQDSRWSRFREAMEARLVDAGIGGSLDEFLG